MFNLDNAIHIWKENLGQQSGLRSEDTAELETHLRDSFAQLTQRGLTEEEVFFVARNRLGTPSDLSREFTKVNGNTLWRQRLLWMVAGFLVLSGAGYAIQTLGHSVGLIAMWFGMEGTSAGIMTSVLTFGGFGLLIWALCRLAAAPPTTLPSSFVSLGSWGTRKPLIAGLVLIASYLGLFFVQHVMTLTAVTQMRVQTYGEFVAPVAVFNIGLDPFLFIFLTLLLLRLRNRTRGKQLSESRS